MTLLGRVERAAKRRERDTLITQGVLGESLEDIPQAMAAKLRHRNKNKKEGV